MRRSEENGSGRTDARTAGATAEDLRAVFQRALERHQNGQLAEARIGYESVIRAQPGHADSLHLLGVIAIQTRDLLRAVELIETAIGLNPGSAVFHGNLGSARAELGQYEAAIACHDRAIAIDPNAAEHHCNRGISLGRLQRTQAALESYDRAIALKPDYFSAYCGRAKARYLLERLQAALDDYDRAIALQPDHAEVHSNRGVVLHNLGRYEEAIASYDRAITIRRDDAEAWSNRGLSLTCVKRYGAALESIDRAIAIRPTQADYHCNRGNALQHLGRFEVAVASYEQAIALQPDYVDAHSNLGNTLGDLKRFDAAIASYDRALAIKPDAANANYNKALKLLMRGDFKQGWPLYEWRWHHEELSKARRNFPQPLWLGTEALAGKRILLHGEQGFGDTIQFCRYARHVSALGATVILEAPAPLLGILRDLPGVDHLVAFGAPLPDFDFHCPLLSLPLAFGTDAGSIPGGRAYLRADPGKVSQWSATLGHTSKLRAGIVWSGNPGHSNDANRSLGLETFISRLPPDFEYVSLQKRVPRDSDQATLAAHPEILHFGDRLEDFSDTAALCELMDLVISVDTSVAHLSCALGKPTWILLPFRSDWRWLLDRSDSPWYPAARLYRQHDARDWDEVLQRIRADLDALAEPVPAVYQRALGLHQRGQLAPAQAAYETVLRRAPQHADALHWLGVIAIQKRDYPAALERLTRAVALQPDTAAFHFNLGIALQATQQLEAAIACYDRTIALQPDHADACCNRGVACHQLGRFAAAIESYDRAIALRPAAAELYCFNRGNSLDALQDYEAAVASYDQALLLRPDHAESHFNRGLSLHNLQRFELAIASYDRVLALKPDHAEAHCNRAAALQKIDQHEAALASCDRAIALKPRMAHAHCNRGMSLKALRRHPEAIASCDQAIALKPDLAEAYLNRGVILKEQRQYDAAIADYRRALALRPDYADAHSSLGNALGDLKHFDAAIASYDRAITIDPDGADAGYNKSLTLLLCGDFSSGWPLYELRWRQRHIRKWQRNFVQPQWRGTQSLAGRTVLLHAEQGFGDTIQFCRYARLVHERGARVILELPTPLMSLLQGLEGVSDFVELGQALPEFDYHCPLLSLPLAFATDLGSIPAPPAYLQCDPARSALWSRRLGARSAPRVGLVWSGNPDHGNDAGRSLALSMLLPFLPDGFDYVSLQKQVRETDQAALSTAPRIRHFGDRIQDFSDTAALCGLMDLVISVDTSVAHLSGALGKPTWILLPFRPDWRWLLDRGDSPWYPSARLYRQDVIGDWTSVLQQVRRDLLGRAALPRMDAAAAPVGRQAPPPPVTSATAFPQALALHQQGRLAEARSAYERILQSEPGHADALHLSGVIAVQTGDPARGVDLIGKAIVIKPASGVFHGNLGSALLDLRRYPEALATYERAIALNPQDAGNHYGRGIALRQLDRLDQAVASYDQAIALKPDHANAHFNRGNALVALQRPQAALASYEQAIALGLNDVDIHFSRGVALAQLEDFAAAASSYERAIALRPGHAEAHVHHGIVLGRMQRFAEAIAAYDKALAIKPDHAEASRNRDLALRQNTQLDAAIADYAKGLPAGADPLDVKILLGHAFRDLKRFDQAIERYDEVIAADPQRADTHFYKALTLLSCGDFHRGWPLYEWRWRHASFIRSRRDFSEPLWLGTEPLAGKRILLHAEQGFGDTIQFCRYAVLVKGLGAEVILEVPQPLRGLLSKLEGVDQWVEAGQVLPPFDCQCPLLSLPLALGTDAGSIPSAPAYLYSDPAKVAQWAERIGPARGPRIGLVWSGNIDYVNDHRRSVDLAGLISRLPAGLDYVSLQKEVREADAVTLSGSPIRHFGAQIGDFSDTAALCSLMDLVVSVDTSVAHLSCALGKPTWILLPFRPDWRWQHDRKDSPWYPSAKLFRQETASGDWSETLERLQRALAGLAGTPPGLA